MRKYFERMRSERPKPLFWQKKYASAFNVQVSLPLAPQPSCYSVFKISWTKQGSDGQNWTVNQQRIIFFFF